MGWTFYNSNGQRLSTATTLIDNLDIDGATDIGAAIVDADLFIIDDGAGGTNRKTAASRLKTYIGAAATQAEMEAGSSTSVFVTPGRTHFHPGTAKVWSHMTGSGHNQASYNVASTAKDSTGVYTVTIATDFSNADSSVVAVANGTSGADMECHVSDIAAGSYKITTISGESSADLSNCSAAFGDI